jgi:hypothetical protein
MIKIIKEKFLDGLHITLPEEDFDKYVEFYINPSTKEIKDCKDSANYPFACRGIITEDGVMIVWRGDLLHYNALQYLSRNPTEWSKKELKNILRNKPNYVLIEIDSHNEVILHNDNYSYGHDFDIDDLIHNFENKNPYIKLSQKYFIDKAKGHIKND